MFINLPDMGQVIFEVFIGRWTLVVYPIVGIRVLVSRAKSDSVFIS